MTIHYQFHDQGLSGVNLDDGILKLYTERYDDDNACYVPGILTFSNVQNIIIDDQATEDIQPLSAGGEIIHVETQDGKAFLIIIWDDNRAGQVMTFYNFSFDAMSGEGSAILQKRLS